MANSVASIIEDLLQVVKTSSPSVNKANLRSNDTGCYHNNCLIASFKEIGKHVGVAIVR